MAAPTVDIKFSDLGTKNEPSVSQKNDGWFPGDKPEAEVMNYLMNGYWQWIEYLKVGGDTSLEATVDGVKASVGLTSLVSGQIVSGVLNFDTALKSNKTINFPTLPDPINGNTVVLKNNMFEVNFSAGQRLNLIRRKSWSRDFTAVGVISRSIVVYNDEVFVLNGTGSLLRVFDLQGNSLRSWSSGSTSPLSMSVYNDQVFILDSNTNLVYVFDLFGNVVTNFPSGSTSPTGIDVYNDEVFVCDNNTDLVYVFNLAGAAQRNFSTVGDFSKSITVYNDEVFVLDDGADLVYVFDLVGTALRNFASGTSFAQSITVYNDEVFVLDGSPDKVLVYDLDGVAIRNFASDGPFPISIAVYNDEVFVADETDVYIKSIHTDDTDATEAYKIKGEIPFAYIGGPTP